MENLLILLQSQPVTLSPNVVGIIIGGMTTFITATAAAIVKLFVDYVKHRKDYLLHKKEFEQVQDIVASNLMSYNEDKSDLKHLLDAFQKELHKHALDSQKMNGELKAQIAGIDGKLEMLLNSKKK